MLVTYIAHSGFLLEWKDCYWLFDYFKGEIPDLDINKKLFIFSSHSHSDHFNPELFSLFKNHLDKEFIFSSDIQPLVDELIQDQPDIKQEYITYLKEDEDLWMSDGVSDIIEIHTLKSTDLGVAFFIEYQDKLIYHAGDLHWWIWPGEPDDENEQMTCEYKEIMKYLEGKVIDVAFTPLDPRQDEWYDRGCDYLLEIAHIIRLFPMHFGDDYSVIDRYLSSRQLLPNDTNFIKIEREGQTWEVEE